MELMLKADNLLGGDFNIFSVLNMERLEVRTHSALIYELLNPNGSHSQDHTYLKIFIDDIFEIEMKIDAGDQKNQLKTYNEYCIQCGKKYHIFYLTLYDYEASEYSTGNEIFNIISKIINHPNIIEWG